MKTKTAVWDVLAAVFLLALVTTLVRPSSLAPSFIKNFGEAMSSLVKYAING